MSTQTERVLHALQSRPDGICSVDIVHDMYIDRASDVIFKLRQPKYGSHNIRTEDCPKHDGNVHANYVYVRPLNSGDIIEYVWGSDTGLPWIDPDEDGDMTISYGTDEQGTLNLGGHND